jgi:hypothetical protein
MALPDQWANPNATRSRVAIEIATELVGHVAIERALFERRMKPNVRCFIQLNANLPIRRCDVNQVRLRGLQRRKERFAQVAMEAFDLAFRLCSIRSA